MVEDNGDFLAINALLIKNTIMIDDISVRILGKTEFIIRTPDFELGRRGVQLGGPLLPVLVG